MAEKFVEVCATPDMTTTDRGRLLEQLASDIFAATGYKPGAPLRLTATEVDIRAVHGVTGVTVYAECKAHRDPVSADVLMKLLGTVVFHEVEEGWLISTARLTKDGEGLKSEWERRAPATKRRLQIYDPPRLLELLVNSGRVGNPDKFQTDHRLPDAGWYLLVTPFGRFWARLLVQSGIPRTVTVFHAETGIPVSDSELIVDLQKTDCSLNEYDWKISPAGLTATAAAESVADEVVLVSEGESWADYRPSRPQDFVGRQDIIKRVFLFFSSVASGTSSTRLFSFRSPSGWGKSSLIAKARNIADNKNNRNRYHLVAVDVRAARSSHYVAASILGTFKSAVDTGFLLPPVIPLAIGPSSDPMTSESVRDCLEQLRAKKRLLILVFDQFEEVFTKPDLRSLFDRLRQLALSVDAQQENFIIGFAWKSDAFVPQDHPAYHMWHGLSDRRLDLEVPLFRARDVSNALSLFQRELGQTLNPVLRSQLEQHCQGYPWLLKKLCLHILRLARRGLNQSQMLERSMDIRELFEDDLSGLSAKETLCLKEVAKQAPADWVKIAEQFGNDSLASLLDGRLMVRSGDRLNPYWDIFGDYLRTGNIPRVPVSFLPGTEPSTLVMGARYVWMQRGEGISVNDLASAWGRSGRSALNVVRDLRFFGLAERKGDSIATTLERNDTADILEQIGKSIRESLSNHVFTLTLRDTAPPGTLLREEDLTGILRKSIPFANLRQDTQRTYAIRLARYLDSVGYLTRSGSEWVVPEPVGQPEFRIRVGRRTGEFVGDAPPERVCAAMTYLGSRAIARTELDAKGFRNASSCLISLGLIGVHEGRMKVLQPTVEVETQVAKAVKSQRAFLLAQSTLVQEPKIDGLEVGRRISKALGASWLDSSCIRRGNAIRRWVKWVAAL